MNETGYGPLPDPNTVDTTRYDAWVTPAATNVPEYEYKLEGNPGSKFWRRRTGRVMRHDDSIRTPTGAIRVADLINAHSWATLDW